MVTGREKKQFGCAKSEKVIESNFVTQTVLLLLSAQSHKHIVKVLVATNTKTKHFSSDMSHKRQININIVNITSQRERN